MNNSDFVQLVDKAINSFELQGEFSRVDHGGCFYLRFGKSCIVGHMMPDDATRHLADTDSDSDIENLYFNGFEWTKQFDDLQIHLLKDLQCIHDKYEYFGLAIKDMRYILRKYKEDYNV